MSLTRYSLSSMQIRNERAFARVPLYQALKASLSAYRFRVLPAKQSHRWDLALALNLTFWSAEGGGDIVLSRSIEPDVIAHIAWHHLAHRALVATGKTPSADAMILGESIASAFDLFMLGHLLRTAPNAPFVTTQVPAMAETCNAWGLSARGFEQMLAKIAADPEAAFKNLRELLFDCTTKLLACKTAEQAHQVFEHMDKHPYAPLLHRYELSNWVLYCRAYASKRSDAAVRKIDKSLRICPRAIAYLETHWLQ
jgi:hypothetical protein